MVKFKVTGLKELQRELDSAAREIPKEVDQEIKRIADEILNVAISKVPVKMGALKGSSFIEKIEGGYTIGFSIKYAPYIEFGSGPLTEVPKGYESFAMEFYVDGSGRNSPQPFLFPAFLSRRDKIVEEIETKINEYLKRF